MPVGDFDCTPAAGNVGGLMLTDKFSGFSVPVQMKAAPDDPDRLYVVEKGGVVKIIENGQTLGTPFIDISSLVQDNGEEGLLGLAFHPDYATNGRFWLHYSASNANGSNVVQEFHRSDADHHLADPNPVKLVMKHGTAQSNHNGGAVEWGPDNFLYVSMGDGGQQNDPECDAQLRMPGDGSLPSGVEDQLGKISRYDVDAACDPTTGCPAAPGNPGSFKGYHVGFRNPWRISFDACAPYDLYVGDVGQDTYEEIDVIPGASGAVNGGWPYREGMHDFVTNNNCPAKPATLMEPVAEYKHNSDGTNRCSVTGGYVYRSSAAPALRGAYFYGDYCSGEIWYKFPGQAEVHTTLNVGNQLLGAFGQDGRGNVYALMLNGDIQRIDAQ